MDFGGALHAAVEVIDLKLPSRIGQDYGIATVAWQRRGAVADLDSTRRPFGVPLGNALGADSFRGPQNFPLVRMHQDRALRFDG